MSRLLIERDSVCVCVCVHECTKRDTTVMVCLLWNTVEGFFSSAVSSCNAVTGCEKKYCFNGTRVQHVADIKSICKKKKQNNKLVAAYYCHIVSLSYFPFDIIGVLCAIGFSS